MVTRKLPPVLTVTCCSDLPGDYLVSPISPISATSPSPAPAKRGRGRPRKILVPLEVALSPPVEPSRTGMTVRGEINETGEKVYIEATTRKLQYTFKGRRYLNLGIMNLTAVLKLGLTQKELVITFWLPTIASKGNMVVVRYKDANAFCKIARSGLSRTLTKLVGKRVLRRESAGTFTINPHFAWRGSAKEHQEAVREWDAWEVAEDRRAAGLAVPVEWPVERVG